MDDRRATVLELLADPVLLKGLSASSLRAAKMSYGMLLYNFKDKAEMIAATMAVISQRLATILADVTTTPLPLGAIRAKLAPLLLADKFWPYMRRWLEIASMAASGDALAMHVGAQISRGLLAWGEVQLDYANPQQKAVDAAKLLVAAEGMLLLKSIEMYDVSLRAI
jgi:AcrR family transcriptional regulator